MVSPTVTVEVKSLPSAFCINSQRKGNHFSVEVKQLIEMLTDEQIGPSVAANP
jgi:hypothetical protein